MRAIPEAIRSALRRSRPSRSALASVIIGAAATATLLGHKPTSSRFGFDEHLRPIIERRCGACHGDGGAAPMALLDHAAARPWAEAIKEETLLERMPPNAAASDFDLLDDRSLAAAEIDRLADWATGGAPKLAAASQDSPAAPRTAAVDRAREDPESFDLERDVDFVLPAGAWRRRTLEAAIEGLFPEDRWLAALRVVPLGPIPPAALRIDVEAGADSPARSGVPLSLWQAGDGDRRYPPDAAAPIPAGAALRLTAAFYRPFDSKRGAFEAPATLRARIALRFAPPRPARRVEALLLTLGEPAAAPGALGSGAELLGVLAGGLDAAGTFEVRLDGASGSRLLIAARGGGPLKHAAWTFREPIRIESGSRLSLSAPSLKSGGPEGALRVWVEIASPPN